MRATPAIDGKYRLNLTINDSSVTAESAQTMNRGVPPSLNNFTSNASLSLRDGETIQYTTAADKLTGEIVKVDVTVNVVK